MVSLIKHKPAGMKWEKTQNPKELSRNTANGRSGYKHPKNYGWGISC
jgi:hypothetical protein